MRQQRQQTPQQRTAEKEKRKREQTRTTAAETELWKGKKDGRKTSMPRASDVSNGQHMHHKDRDQRES